MTPLPRIMVAPNGARRGKADHPALPITIPEIVACDTACHAAGADGLHAHVRDAEGAHVLDAGLYAELLAELARAVPAMQVQVTTEAVGRYTPSEQRRLVETLHPPAVSIALREITAEPDTRITARFFRFCAEAGIAFGPAETAILAEACRMGGKARIGFENNLLNADGSVATDNAERVAELADLLARPPS